MNKLISDSLLPVDVASQIFYSTMEIANLLLEKWRSAGPDEVKCSMVPNTTGKSIRIQTNLFLFLHQ